MTAIDPRTAALAVERFTWRTIAEQFAAVSGNLLSCQRTVEMSGWHDNYEDAAQARRGIVEATKQLQVLIDEVRQMNTAKESR
jgi:hypothetical protein